MRIIRVRYQPGPVKMVLAGTLGACFHVLIDGFYHFDVQPMYPNKVNYLWRWVNESWATDAATKQDIKIICILFFVPLFFLYLYNLKKPKQ